MIELTPASQVSSEHWPEILFHKHADWFWPLSTIARSTTAYFGRPPIKIDGNAEEITRWYFFTGYYWKPCPQDTDGAEAFTHPNPITARGEWWKGDPDYYAATTSNGWYRRTGYRFDDVDGYYEYPSWTLKPI